MKIIVLRNFLFLFFKHVQMDVICFVNVDGEVMH